MSRRTTSLAVASIALVALVAVAFLVPMPYVVMSPGVTENTIGTYKGKPVITIRGHRTYPSAGHLDLTTVSVSRPTYRPRLPEIMHAWWSREDIVLPRDVIYPPSQTNKEAERQKTAQMLDSQTSAIVAGLAEAGFDALDVKVTAVESGAPADGVIQRGDLIESVDGKPMATTLDTVAAIRNQPPGSRVRLGLERDGKPLDVQLTTDPAPDDSSRSRVGVALRDKFDPPFKVDIELGQDIGGPSAGLMFSLAIYDLLTPGALSGGRFVAGTGTIDLNGRVGNIGGVQQKIAGARRQGASVFLVPEGDCSEAAGSDVADEIELVSVATLTDAVDALKALDSGDDQAIPRCKA